MPLRWACPVAVRTRVYTAKSDVYSYGVVLWEIFAGGAKPYPGLMTAEVQAAVEAGHRLPPPSNGTPAAVVQLIRDCTQMAVALRPSMQTVCQRLQIMLQALRSTDRTLQPDATAQAKILIDLLASNPGFDPRVLEAEEVAAEDESAL